MTEKRIVFLRSNAVAPDSRVEKEVNSLLKAGYKVEIVAWDRDAKYGVVKTYLDFETNKARVYRFGIPASFGGGIKSNLRPLMVFQIKLLKWLYKNKANYDVIHACDFDTAFTAYAFAKLFNKKIVYDIFDYYIDSFKVPRILKAFIENRDHKIINSADAVIICTEKRKEQIKGTNPRRLIVIHNTPYKVNNASDKSNIDKSKVKIVYVGILAGGRFIKEMADFVINNQNYELHIGGFGKYEGYFKEISKNYENIVFYGKLPYEKTLELESSCDIITAIYDPKIPNHFYAAPNKFYEALMLGKPVIMAKNTGMDEIVSQNDIGEVIDYNLKSFENAIEKLVGRRNEWFEMSLRMKEIYRKDYCWEEMGRRLIELYRALPS